MGRPFRLDSLNDGRSPVRRTAASENRTVTRPPGRRHLSSRPACSVPSRSAPRSSPGVVRSLGRFLLVQLGGLPVETDVSTGVWISSARRRGEPGTVGALVPAVFEAYARDLPSRGPLRRGRRRRGLLVRGRGAQRHRRLTRSCSGSRSPAVPSTASPRSGTTAPARAISPSPSRAGWSQVLARHTAHRGRLPSSGAGTASATTCRSPERAAPAAAARRPGRRPRPRRDRRRRPQPGARAARAEREPLVAGRPRVVRGHRHRPDEHLRRRQRGVRGRAAGPPGVEAAPATGDPAATPQPGDPAT